MPVTTIFVLAALTLNFRIASARVRASMGAAGVPIVPDSMFSVPPERLIVAVLMAFEVGFLVMLQLTLAVPFGLILSVPAPVALETLPLPSTKLPPPAEL